jgi:predicted nuclease of restriction endonuclease-like RecB superfamily
VTLKSLLIADTVDVYVEIVKFFKVHREEYRDFNFWKVSIFRDMKICLGLKENFNFEIFRF